MTVNRTTLLDLPLPVTGTESGTWGDTTNNGLTQYMDIAIAGMSNLTSANFTAGALTIETTEGDSSATNISATSAQYAGFRVSSLAVNSTITVGNTGTSPARSYRLINADATYSLTFKATGQTGVTLLPGQSAVVAFNGTDYVIVGVVGAGSTTDNTVPRFDGTTGEILQSSGITIDDSNNVSGVGQLNATTLDATNIEVTNIKAKDGTAAASIADSTGKITVSTELAVDNLNLSGNTLSSTDTNGNIEVAPNGNGSVVITNAGTNAALRITQTGSGNALLVEDSANPDSSPFIVNADGRVIAGYTSAITNVASGTPQVQVHTAIASSIWSSLTSFNWSSGAQGGGVNVAKSRSGTVGTQTIVQNNDMIGAFGFYGSDGTNFIEAALIRANVDGTPGTNDMPGRLMFFTTADGASSPTERMRIDSAGNIGIDGSPTAGIILDITKTQTGATSAITVSARINPDSTVTSAGYGFTTFAINSVGASTTDIFHYSANQGTYSGTAPTNQYGFVAQSTLTGATNNYGFFSNIASGTGRWNFYANGTAQNYFEGLVGLKTTANNGGYLEIGGTANVVSNSGYGVTQYQTIPSTATSQYWLNTTVCSTAAASFTLSDLRHYNAGQGTFGAGSTVTSQYGFFAQSNLTGATNNFGFFSNIASGTGRWNFYANGTAANYFAGSTGIGGVPGSDDALRVAQNSTLRRLTIDISSDTATVGPSIKFYRTRTTGTNVSNNDLLGEVIFQGVHTSTFPFAADIQGYVDGTPGANDLPGRLVFRTTADGASSPTERMRITSSGQVGIGGTPSAGQNLLLGKTMTGAATASSLANFLTISSDVTTNAKMYESYASTAASAFTLSSLSHFNAVQGTIGAGSAITSQYGFNADATLTGATNNYGFFSNIASGTGRWNFFANGTADNYFAGRVGIGIQAAGNVNLRVGANITGGVFSNLVYATGQIQSDVTSAAAYFRVQSSQASGFTAANVTAFLAEQGTFSGTVTNQFGFEAQSTLIGATNNYGFYSNIASGSGRWNFYANGTAANFFAGRVGIGDATDVGAAVFINYAVAGSGGVGYGIKQNNTATSAVTSSFIQNESVLYTQATSFTLASYKHFSANQGSVGAGSTVTNQYGFVAESTLTGATNNYGFFSNIASGSNRWNFYANGTAENYLGGNLKIGGTAARATTAGTNQLVLFDGTAPVGTLTNGVSFYSASGEARVMDAAGNSTLLSPHDAETNEWIYHSVHTPTGKKLRIDMEKMMRFLNEHFGLDFIHEE